MRDNRKNLPIKIRVALKELPHKCERVLLVPEDITMRQLHFVIQEAMSWTNSHLFEFLPEKFKASLAVGIENDYDYIFVKTTDANKGRLKEAFLQDRVGRPFWYEYDFGDGWMHRITFLKVTSRDKEVFVGFPLCLKAVAKCPPEDCGGRWGYADFLEAIKDKKHPEYKENREWIGLEPGEEYDETEVSLENINKLLLDLAISKFWKSQLYSIYDL